MTKVVVAPEPLIPPRKAIFLAGGITGCPDWQADAVDLFGDWHGVLLNPRRPDFPIHDPGAAGRQIRWEHRALHLADAILFWFPAESICPIALYELGAWSMTPKPLFVGCASSYPRRADVEIQAGLARPDVRVRTALTDVVDDALMWGEVA